MPEDDNQDNLFPARPDVDDNLYPTNPDPGGELFTTHRDVQDNLFSAGEITPEEIRRLERFAEEKDLSPTDRARLFAQYRDVGATHKKPKQRDDDSLW